MIGVTVRTAVTGCIRTLDSLMFMFLVVFLPAFLAARDLNILERILAVGSRFAESTGTVTGLAALEPVITLIAAAATATVILETVAALALITAAAVILETVATLALIAALRPVTLVT